MVTLPREAGLPSSNKEMFRTGAAERESHPIKPPSPEGWFHLWGNVEPMDYIYIIPYNIIHIIYIYDISYIYISYIYIYISYIYIYHIYIYIYHIYIYIYIIYIYHIYI